MPLGEPVGIAGVGACQDSDALPTATHGIDVSRLPR